MRQRDYIFLLLVWIFISAPLRSICRDQLIDSGRFTRCKQTVKEINSHTLTKAYLHWDREAWELSAIKLCGGSEQCLNEFSVFKYSQNHIRKIIYINYLYGYDVMVCYYDGSGRLIHAVFELGLTDTESCAGHIYLDAQGVIYSNVIYDDAAPSDESVPAIREESRYNEDFSVMTGYFPDEFTHTDKFMSSYNVENFPSGCVRVTFRDDASSGKTIIAFNNVRVRNKPGLDGGVIKVLNAGRDVTIISRGIEDNIAPWGKYYWYEIEFENFFIGDQKGYVFGAFLEPVERIVE